MKYFLLLFIFPALLFSQRKKEILDAKYVLKNTSDTINAKILTYFQNDTLLPETVVKRIDFIDSTGNYKLKESDVQFLSFKNENRAYKFLSANQLPLLPKHDGLYNEVVKGKLSWYSSYFIAGNIKVKAYAVENKEVVFSGEGYSVINKLKNYVKDEDLKVMLKKATSTNDFLQVLQIYNSR